MATDPYISATVAIIVIVAISLLCAIMVLPLLNKSFSKYILSLLTMLAVGCLSGDAIFHLVPHALGLDHKRDISFINTTRHISNSNDAGHHDMIVVSKCALIIASIYLFYLLNNVMNFCQIGHAHSHGHSHTIPHLTLPISDNSPTSCKLRRDRNRSSTADAVSSIEYKKDEELVKLLPKEPHQDGVTHSGILEGPNLNDESHQHDQSFSFRRVPKIVWMLYMSGLLHNVTDGLAVGASFAGGFPGGISTTLAVLFHEIPHAIGDVVILTNSGLKAKIALLFMSSTYITSFIGCYCGVALGRELNIVQWIFAVTAGMFLYIALVELLPDTIDDAEERGPKHLTDFLWQNVGFLMGAGIMALIAVYEDDIRSAFKQ